MVFSEKELVYRAAKGYLGAAARERLPELEKRFEELYAALAGGREGGLGGDAEGLPFAAVSATGTVGAAVWTAAQFIAEVVRHRTPWRRARALARLAPRLAEATNDSPLVTGLHKRVEALRVELEVLARAAGEARSPAGAIVELRIERAYRDGRPYLAYDLDAEDPALGLNHLPFSSDFVERTLKEVVGELFQEIEELTLKSPRQPAYVGDELAAKGVGLAEELIPERLQEHLRAAEGRAVHLQLQSEEPHIPWELLKLRHPDVGGGDDEPFLCESFALARWFRGQPKVARLSLSHLALIVPRDSALASARAEGEELQAALAPHCRVEPVPARYEEVMTALTGGRFDAFHFSGHGLDQGDAPDRWSIWLENRQRLTPELISNRARGLGGRRPLIFLNSCHTGKGGFAVTGLGGWSRRLLKAGAGAFLGCHWAVPDDKAREFALAFYLRLLAGLSIAEAVQGARLELRDRHSGDPTWLAYTLFAHPPAMVRQPARSATVRKVVATASAAKAEQAAEKPPSPAEAMEQATAGETGGGPARRPARGRSKRRVRRRATPAAGPLQVPEAPQYAMRSAAGEPDNHSSTSVHCAVGTPADPRPRIQVHESPVPATPARPQPPSPSPPTPASGEERVNQMDGTVLLYVPGGAYSVGAKDLGEWSRPVRTVILSPFWIARAPVTNEQYGRFLAANPDRPRPAFWEDPRFSGPQQPVVGVSWEEARAYCRWAGLELPTEVQWEAAARGPGGCRYPWGDEPPSPSHANFGNRLGATSPVDAHPLGAGPFGTLDQVGNVWEWCRDPWSSTAYRDRESRELDPIAQGDPSMRAVRGGAWINPANDLRAATRDRAGAQQRVKTQGFRCVWCPR